MALAGTFCNFLHLAYNILQVEGEASDAEEQLRNYQKALNQAKREAEQLSSGNQRAQAELLAASSWKGL